MRKEKIHRALAEMRDQVSSNHYSIAACVYAHVETILKLKSEGVSFLEIRAYLNIEMSIVNFRNQVSRSKIKKAKAGNLTVIPIERTKVNPIKNEQLVPIKNEEIEGVLKNPLEKWMLITRLSEGGIPLFLDAEQAGLAPEDFKKLKNFSFLYLRGLVSDWKKANKPSFTRKENITKEEFFKSR